MARILVVTDSKLVADLVVLALGRGVDQGLVLCVVSPQGAGAGGADGEADLAIVDLSSTSAGAALEDLLAGGGCPRILAILGAENYADMAGLGHLRVRCLPRSASVAGFAKAVLDSLPRSGRGPRYGRTPVLIHAAARAADARAHAEVRGSLTEREIEVLTLLGAGSTNKAIAEALGVTVPTVKNHVSGILRKLRVRSRRELGSGEVLLL